MVYRKLALIDLLIAKTRVMDVATQVQISQVYADTATTFMIGFAVSVTYAGLLILVMSHRVSGPMIAIVDTIEQLIKGNYGYKRALRHGDELIPIQEHLQELSVRLKVKEVDAKVREASFVGVLDIETMMKIANDMTVGSFMTEGSGEFEGNLALIVERALVADPSNVAASRLAADQSTGNKPLTVEEFRSRK